jgi:dipeptidyl aminopeptidase/acylaminoacyl peptidase
VNAPRPDHAAQLVDERALACPARFIHRVRRSEDCEARGTRNPDPVRTRTVVAVTCAVAVALAVAWATGVGSQSQAAARAAPQLAWRSVHMAGVSGVLALPPHARALAIVIHGGEIASNRPRAALSTRVAARVYSNHLVPLGIGVLSVDYRWSGYGGGELSDVAAALSYAGQASATARLPVILIGASHGGYLAALAATTPAARAARVQAVVDLYGFSNLGATVSDPSSRWDRQARLTLRELGPPARNQSLYAARSPLSRAGLLSAPVLQVVGGRDRATRPDVLALTRAIRRSGGSATLHVIPGSTHGFAFGTTASPIVWNDVAGFLQQLHLAN